MSSLSSSQMESCTGRTVRSSLWDNVGSIRTSFEIYCESNKPIESLPFGNDFGCSLCGHHSKPSVFLLVRSLHSPVVRTSLRFRRPVALLSSVPASLFFMLYALSFWFFSSPVKYSSKPSKSSSGLSPLQKVNKRSQNAAR